MSLSIERLELTLPASLGTRKHAIQRLLRQELTRLTWPQGRWPGLPVPEVGIAANTTNLGIARALARQMNRAAWQRSHGQLAGIEAVAAPAGRTKPKAGGET